MEDFPWKWLDEYNQKIMKMEDFSWIWKIFRETNRTWMRSELVLFVRFSVKTFENLERSKKFSAVFKRTSASYVQTKLKNQINQVRLDDIPQCGNFRIFLQLRFYVKSNLITLNPQKLLFSPFEQLWIFNFWEILTFSSVKFFQKSKFIAFKIVKMTVFETLNSTKLISRKIWGFLKSNKLIS